MNSWLRRSAIDARFVDFAIFVSVSVWLWLVPATAFMAVFAWKFVLLCQAVALPFSVSGWSVGFLLGRSHGLEPQQAAMLAGWSGLLLAEIGLALVLFPSFGKAALGSGLWALPGLAVSVTLGVKWFYRKSTWADWNEGWTT